MNLGAQKKKAEVYERAEQQLDRLETMILMAIDANPTVDERYERYGLVELVDISASIRTENRAPDRFYTFDATSSDRIFTTDYRLLANHPSEIIGSGTESMVMTNDGIIKWLAYFPTRKPKIGVATLGKADKWFEVHYMDGTTSGWNGYQKRYAAITKDGAPLSVKFMGQKQGLHDSKKDKIILHCSLIEDAHRSTAFLATASSGKTAVFPVGIDGYKDFFSLRDAPRDTPTKRLNPILHWVRRHLRRQETDAPVEVRKHLRGTETVTIGGMTATISPN